MNDNHSNDARNQNQDKLDQSKKPRARSQGQLLSIGEVSSRYGLSISAIRRYVAAGNMKAFLLPSGHRRFKVSDIEEFLGITHEQSSRVLIYARVSSNKQSAGFSKGSEENDLSRQIQRLKDAAREYGEESPVVYSDTGSGLSYTRKAFCKLLDDILSGKWNGCTLLVTHKDRLCRFATEVIEQVCKAHEITLVYTEKESTTDEQELADDLIAIITHFSARTYGQRAAKQVSKELTPQTIRRAKELYDQKVPLWQIREILKDEGHKDSKGTSPSYYLIKKHIVDNELLEIAIPKTRTPCSFELFHDEKIEADENSRLTKKDLYAAYISFCKDNNLIALTAQQVGRILKSTYNYERKFTTRGTIAYAGIRLK